jgi:hypothetical protein
MESYKVLQVVTSCFRLKPIHHNQTFRFLERLLGVSEYRLEYFGVPIA